MSYPVDTTNALDPRGLADLKRLTKTSDPQALKAAARQFEGMFLQMVLKSMRDAIPRDDLLDSDQTRMYESLLDQQLAQVMATKGNGTGLAAMIEKQLSRNVVQTPTEPDTPPLLNPQPKGVPLQRHEGSVPLVPTQIQAVPLQNAPVSWDGGGNGAASGGDGGSAARDFVAKVLPHAQEASRLTGIPAQFLVAHAALETGWGRSEPRHADGRPSFNLFGIKAGRSWNGATVDASTMEYVDGQPQRQTARFRAYGSYAEAFRDYGNLLASNARYGRVVGSTDGTSFARGLQQAGYATDPFYASKLERIIASPTLRQLPTG